MEVVWKQNVWSGFVISIKWKEKAFVMVMKCLQTFARSVVLDNSLDVFCLKDY